MGIMAAVTWTITFFFNHKMLEENPLRDRVGYNNMCVGWDAPPALYVAVPFASVYVYLGLRFAWTDIIRTALVEGRLGHRRIVFSVTSDIVYGLCVACFPLILVLKPQAHPIAHLSVFLVIIGGRNLVLFSNWLENISNTTWLNWAYLASFAAASLLGTVLSLVSFVVYDQRVLAGNPKPAPLLPPAIMMFVDCVWFILLFSASSFFPRSETIHYGQLRAEYSRHFGDFAEAFETGGYVDSDGLEGESLGRSVGLRSIGTNSGSLDKA